MDSFGSEASREVTKTGLSPVEPSQTHSFLWAWMPSCYPGSGTSCPWCTTGLLVRYLQNLLWYLCGWDRKWVSWQYSQVGVLKWNYKKQCFFFFNQHQFQGDWVGTVLVPALFNHSEKGLMQSLKGTANTLITESQIRTEMWLNGKCKVKEGKISSSVLSLENSTALLQNEQAWSWARGLRAWVDFKLKINQQPVKPLPEKWDQRPSQTCR